MKKYKNFILYDGEQDFLYQMKCADIILLLHTLCKELCLDFQDFKEAFVEKFRTSFNKWMAPKLFPKQEKTREFFKGYRKGV